MNTVICFCLLVCLSLAYTTALPAPEPLADIAVPISPTGDILESLRVKRGGHHGGGHYGGGHHGGGHHGGGHYGGGHHGGGHHGGHHGGHYGR